MTTTCFLKVKNINIGTVFMIGAGLGWAGSENKRTPAPPVRAVHHLNNAFNKFFH